MQTAVNRTVSLLLLSGVVQVVDLPVLLACFSVPIW